MTKMVVLALAMFTAGLLIGRGLATPAVEPYQVEQADNRAVTGIGGVFFKAADPAALRAWYRDHLGMNAGAQGVNFFWRDEHDASRFGRTVWSVFPEATTYFGDGGRDVMINYRVRDLDALLEKLRTQGVQQVGGVEEYPYGRFAWILDGEGNRVELWEPVDHSPEDSDWE